MNHKQQAAKVTAPPSSRKGAVGKALYGLLGYPLGHSFSRSFFNDKFAQEGIDAEYLNFELQSIEQLPQVLHEHPDLRGLNVTIPYKQAVIPYLDELSDEARAIGAVNVVRIIRSPRVEKGRQAYYLKGYNSDIIGFTDSIRPLLQPHHTKALVLGTGGASKAICCGLEKLGIQWRYVSRTKAIPPAQIPTTSAIPTSPALSTSSASLSTSPTLPQSSILSTSPTSLSTSPALPQSSILSTSPEPISPRSPLHTHTAACPVLGDSVAESPLSYSDITTDILAEYTVIVNCSPLGMFPNVDTCPDIPYRALTHRHLLYDLVYNPEVTLFMRHGRRQGATVKSGLEMLHRQAIASWDFWNGND